MTSSDITRMWPHAVLYNQSLYAPSTLQQFAVCRDQDNELIWLKVHFRTWENAAAAFTWRHNSGPSKINLHAAVPARKLYHELQPTTLNHEGYSLWILNTGFQPTKSKHIKYLCLKHFFLQVMTCPSGTTWKPTIRVWDFLDRLQRTIFSSMLKEPISRLLCLLILFSPSPSLYLLFSPNGCFHRTPLSQFSTTMTSRHRKCGEVTKLHTIRIRCKNFLNERLLLGKLMVIKSENHKGVPATYQENSMKRLVQSKLHDEKSKC